MRLSDTITIYLAAGAPFGVTSYLSRPRGRSRLRAFISAAGTSFLWPLAGAVLLFTTRRALKRAPREDAQAFTEQDIEKIDRARRQMIAALNRFQEWVAPFEGKESKKMEQAASIIRERIETYTGLMIVAAESNKDGPPGAREMELCRIAGRRGDDLLLAGRCTHRQNVARILAHRARAHHELVDALASLREAAEDALPATLMSEQATRDLTNAIQTIMGSAIELCSLLHDEGAALSVARLLDAQGARQRRPETSQRAEAHRDALKEMNHVRITHSAWPSLAHHRARRSDKAELAAR